MQDISDLLASYRLIHRRMSFRRDGRAHARPAHEKKQHNRWQRREYHHPVVVDVGDDLCLLVDDLVHHRRTMRVHRIPGLAQHAATLQGAIEWRYRRTDQLMQHLGVVSQHRGGHRNSYRRADIPEQAEQRGAVGSVLRWQCRERQHLQRQKHEP